jgi:hypothetical protein
MYGKEFVQELEATKGKPFKWNRCDLEDLITDLNEQVRQEESRVCG